LAAQAEEEAVAEFNKYVVFELNDKTLSPQEEETLLEFGRLFQKLTNFHKQHPPAAA